MQTPPAAKPKVLLFDLGGVIVRWTGLEALSDMTGMSREQVIGLFSSSEIFMAYEVGKCNDETFIKELISVFKLSDIWFFDDTEVNVEAAKQIGMSAFHVDRNLGVVPVLKELGLLS